MGHISKINKISEHKTDQESLVAIKESLKRIEYFLEVISEKVGPNNTVVVHQPIKHDSKNSDTFHSDVSTSNFIPEIEIGNVDM